jgi:hypothetical protein
MGQARTIWERDGDKNYNTKRTGQECDQAMSTAEGGKWSSGRKHNQYIICSSNTSTLPKDDIAILLPPIFHGH